MPVFITLRDKEPRWPGPLCVCRPNCAKDVFSLLLAPGLFHLSRHASESVPLVARFALAREGAWTVIAKGVRVTATGLAFVHILAGAAVSKKAWQTGACVGGAACVDAGGPLGYITVMEASGTVVDGALVHNSHTLAFVGEAVALRALAAKGAWLVVADRVAAAHGGLLGAFVDVIAGPPISSEADGALAGKCLPLARATGRVGVTPVSANVARILKGIRGALPHGPNGVAEGIAQDPLLLVVQDKHAVHRELLRAGQGWPRRVVHTLLEGDGLAPLVSVGA